MRFTRLVGGTRLACASVAGAMAATAAMLVQALPVDAQRFSSPRTPWERSERSNPRIHGGVPGRFDYYGLSLSWSPTFCADNPRADREPQCNRTAGRPYAFVLHGLWPQYERSYPDNCPTAEPPFVQNGTINSMLDIMPSRGLIIHEYKTHGTCSGLAPAPYFELARKLFQKVKIPERYVGTTTNQFVDTRQVIGDFVAANQGLRPDMLAVICGGSGPRLREVRVCFSREGQFRACGNNEVQQQCRAPRVYVPPVRLGPSDPAREEPPHQPGQRSL